MTLNLTDAEGSNLLSLIDAAVKSQGLAVAEMAANLNRKIQAAYKQSCQEAQAAPTPRE